jgi:membrane-bound metal-dependent hydrolase YbcI (DUF457 family)
MMAIGHAVTGAAAGLYTTALAQQEHAGTLLAGALVCAGAALLPDLDHPGSTAARTFGVASELLAHRVASVSRAVHASTRSRWDRPDGDGHRTFTHTLVFAVLAGLAAWAAARVAPVLVVFPLACMAVRGLMPNLHSRIRIPLVRLLPTLGVGALGTWGVLEHLPQPYGALWLGAMTGLGALVHCLGDAITEQGCPILWPLPILGRRWYPIWSPKLLRFRAGGRVEKLIVVPALTLGTLMVGGAMVLPQVVAGLLP